MKIQRIRERFLRCALLLIAATATAAEPTPPTLDKVSQAVAGYFQSLDNYQPGDLVSQRDVAGALEAVAAVGWEVPNSKKIVALALADDSFLVRELATPRGKKFMRKIAKSAGTYSRLDRLSQINKGQDAVKILITDPGGDTIITYMATTPGGRNLGAMMAGTPNGTNLNKPTGRIYTADDLLAVLKKLYAAQFTPQSR